MPETLVPAVIHSPVKATEHFSAKVIYILSIPMGYKIQAKVIGQSSMYHGELRTVLWSIFVNGYFRFFHHSCIVIVYIASTTDTYICSPDIIRLKLYRNSWRVIPRANISISNTAPERHTTFKLSSYVWINKGCWMKYSWFPISKRAYPIPTLPLFAPGRGFAQLVTLTLLRWCQLSQ